MSHREIYNINHVVLNIYTIIVELNTLGHLRCKVA